MNLLKRRETSVRWDSAAAWAIAAAAVLTAMGLARMAELSALCFAGIALWSLLRTGSAHARLQTGVGLPLLLVVSSTALWPACWIVAVTVVVAFREESWVARAASLLTMVFPATVLLAMQAYLHWLGYQPSWMVAG